MDFTNPNELIDYLYDDSVSVRRHGWTPHYVKHVIITALKYTTRWAQSLLLKVQTKYGVPLVRSGTSVVPAISSTLIIEKEDGGKDGSGTTGVPAISSTV